MLVLVGVGTAVLAPAAGPLGIALAFGLALAVLAYAIGPISGCHVNPAVTLGMVLARRLPARLAAGYVLAQVLGGITGAALVLAVASNRTGYRQDVDGLGTNGWAAQSSGHYGFTAAAIVEVALTAVLVLTVLRVTATPAAASTAGLPIGLALLVAHLVAVPVDGTSVNPARSIGPALLHGGAALHQLWLFILAPLAGAVLAAIIHRALTLPTTGGHNDADNSAATPGHTGSRNPRSTLGAESASASVSAGETPQHPQRRSRGANRKRGKSSKRR